MTRVIVDAVLRNKLRDLGEPLELCDDTGRVLAHVTPVSDESQVEFLTPDVSDAELERRAQSSERRLTTAELLVHLENL
jgi:hypothetical protein